MKPLITPTQLAAKLGLTLDQLYFLDFNLLERSDPLQTKITNICGQLDYHEDNIPESAYLSPQQFTDAKDLLTIL